MHTEDDVRELGDILRRTFAVYTRDFSPEMVVVWFDALAAYEVEDVAVALTRHLRDPDAGRFPPKPADVVAHLAGGSTVRSLRAWTVVEKAIRMVGHYVSVAFDDAIIHHVIDEMGGWPKLALTTTAENLKFAGIEFQKRYQGAMLTGGVGSDYPAYLIGETEATQQAGRRSVPRLIGDAAKCQRVMQLSSGTAGLRITNANSVQALAGATVKRLTTGGQKPRGE